MKDAKNPSNKPVDKDDHIMESERRIIVFVDETDCEILEMPADELGFVRPKIVNAKGDEVDVSFDEDIDEFIIQDAIMA